MPQGWASFVYMLIVESSFDGPLNIKGPAKADSKINMYNRMPPAWGILILGSHFLNFKKGTCHNGDMSRWQIIGFGCLFNSEVHKLLSKLRVSRNGRFEAQQPAGFEHLLG